MSEYVMRESEYAKMLHTMWEIDSILTQCETDEEMTTARELKLGEICDGLSILLDRLQPRDRASGILTGTTDYILKLSE